jgi:hypothetical protein
MAVLFEDVGPPHRLLPIDGHAPVERHDADVGFGNLEADMKAFAGMAVASVWEDSIY